MKKQQKNLKKKYLKKMLQNLQKKLNLKRKKQARNSLAFLWYLTKIDSYIIIILRVQGMNSYNESRVFVARKNNDRRKL